MPDLDTHLHVDMLNQWKEQYTLLRRLRRAVRDVISPPIYYGMQWGDPDVHEVSQFVRDRYIRPHVKPDHVGLEIGPGGGRWTRYLLGFRQLYVVDYYPEILEELKRQIDKPNVKFIANNGTDFPGVPPNSVDFVVSIACFVHLEPHLIGAYLRNIASILRRGGSALLTYADQSKIGARANRTFSNVTPELMREMVTAAGFRIVEEDLTTLWNSGIVRFAHRLKA
jgi:phospholipid N-methyltransferase